jgi:hypothetical protein
MAIALIPFALKRLNSLTDSLLITDTLSLTLLAAAKSLANALGTLRIPKSRHRGSRQPRGPIFRQGISTGVLTGTLALICIYIAMLIAILIAILTFDLVDLFLDKAHLEL